MFPRLFLFGLVRVPRWDYDWGYTSAQISLMALDTPITVYRRDKDKVPDTQDIESAKDRWTAKYGNGEKIELSQLLSGYK